MIEKQSINCPEFTEDVQQEAWCNLDNNAFYEEVRPKGLQALAEKAGLLEGCDIEHSQLYWRDAKSILDAASGFGRVVDALRKYQYSGSITAVERNHAQYQYLKQQYGQQATVLQGDITQLPQAMQKFDVIFLLWSGLADFSKQEQPKIVEALSNRLSENGKLIIDTLPPTVTPLDTVQLTPQSFLIKAKHASVRAYKPNYREVKQYVERCHLQIADLLVYQTTTQRYRWLYIITRQ